MVQKGIHEETANREWRHVVVLLDAQLDIKVELTNRSALALVGKRNSLRGDGGGWEAVFSMARISRASTLSTAVAVNPGALKVWAYVHSTFFFSQRVHEGRS